LHIVVMVRRGYQEAVRTDKSALRTGSGVKVVSNTTSAGRAARMSEIGGEKRLDRSVMLTMSLEYQGRRQCYRNR
jgi:hypothetical protein